jgi:3-hydroxyacyl-CoA dehydrogenase
MSAQNADFRKVAVLGAGVMGAQIAAHLVNAKVPCVLFDLPAKSGDTNGIVKKSIEGLKKLQPSPFSTPAKADEIVMANYDEHLPLLRDCDLIIEAISERLDWKKDLYAKVSPFLSEGTIFATNTSGLSISVLSDCFPQNLRSAFCGVHFFNPPRYMTLVELIPHASTDPDLLDRLESFLATTMGKGIVRAKDTPNFIANRVGVFSILSTMRRTEEFGLGFDTVDALTGPLIGRAKSATFRTADVVGLDTLSHVVATMKETLSSDPWHSLYETPGWLAQLIASGAHGQKTGQGIFKKEGKEILVLDKESRSYRPQKKDIPEALMAVLKIKDPSEKFEKLRSLNLPEARFLWSIFSDVFHYAAVLLDEIAHSARDIDFSLRWGYGWEQGPFEIWQAVGWGKVATWVREDIESGRALSKAPLPQWVIGERRGVHGQAGSFSPQKNGFVPRSGLPCYHRQPFPDSLDGERRSFGETVYENEGVKLWTTGDDLAVLSFKSKMHAVGKAVLDGTLEALTLAEEKFKGVVVWQSQPPFSAGANLQELVEAAAAGKLNDVSQMVRNFQKVSQRFKYCRVPLVAAPQGLALGGGCEFLMHAQHVTAALETYTGLVEVGVGLLPAGGGCKEFARRAAAAAGSPGDITAQLKKGFESMAMGKVSTSAEHAKELGYLRPSDTVVFNPFETLYVAKRAAHFLADSLFRPELPGSRFPVAGKPGIATLEMVLVNMKEGHFISDHDYLIGKKMATILCGGEVDEGTLVDEDWLLELEHQHFMELCATAKTQERVGHMLKTGKPLRN